MSGSWKGLFSHLIIITVINIYQFEERASLGAAQGEGEAQIPSLKINTID